MRTELTSSVTHKVTWLEGFSPIQPPSSASVELIDGVEIETAQSGAGGA